ncbi:MAG: hypothetical protein LIO62_03185 [Clostridiales bacterium]|nr:hypothetical protein [Clostridiales bacterium]
MSVSLYYFKNKKIWGFIAVNLLIGIYIASIRLKYPDSLYLDDLYFYAREGLIFNFDGEGFDVQTFMSVLSTVISIPVVCSQFSKNYEAKRCYIATRYKNYSCFYINEIINIAVLCFLLSLFYSLGIFSFCALVGNLELNNTNFLLLYFISVLNSTLLLLAFCLLAIPFCFLNEKAAVLSDIILFLTCTVISYYLPVKYKCFNIIMMYFVNTLWQNGKYVSYNSAVCYMITFSVIILEILLGNRYIKKKDTI